MMELIILIGLALLASTLLLRKVNISVITSQNNAGSFVNQTADRLHARKIVMTGNSRQADTIGEINLCSLDEIPVAQANVNDSRAHIGQVTVVGTGGTASVALDSDKLVLTFERNQLFLDPDEAWFINTLAVVGAATPRFSTNIWYED